MLPRAEGDGRIPAYAYPEAAADAMARAAKYGAWRTEPRGQVPTFPDVRTEDARTLVRGFFRATLGGGWMPPDKTAELLRCYGIPLAELTPARSEDEAVSAFEAVAGPVVLKADVPGLLHKTDAGAVELDLRTEADVRGAYHRLHERFGERQRQVLVQPMIADGTEVIVGVADDHMFGSLVVFGLGGVATRRPRRPRGPAHAADRHRRGQADPLNPLRAAPAARPVGPGDDPDPRGATQPTWLRCATCCSACHGWPTTCPRSPSWTSTRSWPGRTGYSWWTRGSR